MEDNEINPLIIVEPKLNSTNQYAKDMISNGLNTNALILTAKQGAGKGRHDREWHSPEGGLYMTIVLHPHNTDLSYPLYGLALACAASRALEDLDGPPISLKWPNDLLSKERKIGGILSELSGSSPAQSRLILGIGINVNCDVSKFPESIRNDSTSVWSETGKQLSIEQLVVGITKYLNDYISQGSLPTGILGEYKRRCVTIGRHVRVDMIGESFEGKAVDVTDEGLLIVLDQYSNERIISAGEVIHLRSGQ